MSVPLVSVIIPAYNASATIVATLESVLKQSFEGFEIIVVDDGSTDDTADVVKSLQDHRIRYIYQENAERAAARNRGIVEARGQYLAFLDADDLWMDQKLEKQLFVFKDNPSVSLVYSDLIYFDALTGEDIIQYGQKLFKLYRGSVLPQLLKVCFIQSPTPLIKRTVLEKMEWFDPSLPPTEDWDLWLRIAARSFIDYVPEPLARYRFHDYLDNWRRSPDSMLAKTLRIYSKLSNMHPAECRHWKSSFARGCALAYYKYGLALMLNRRYEMARQGFINSIKNDPTLWEVYLRLFQIKFLRIREKTRIMGSG